MKIRPTRAATLAIATAAALLAAGVAATPAPATEARSAADVVRAALSDQISEAGLDPSQFLDAPLAMRLPGPDGAFTEHSTTIGEAIGRLAGSAPVTAADTGIAGTPETNAGDLLHVYASFGRGDQRRYLATESGIVPATDPLVVPVPPSPAGPVDLCCALFHAGGAAGNVKGGGWTVGLHSAGSWAAGSNADTAHRDGDVPVWLPGSGGGFLSDASIDFLGWAEAAQTQACFFGFCTALGVLLGDGITLFDNTTATDPTGPIGLPVVP